MQNELRLRVKKKKEAQELASNDNSSSQFNQKSSPGLTESEKYRGSVHIKSPEYQLQRTQLLLGPKSLKDNSGKQNGRLNEITMDASCEFTPMSSEQSNDYPSKSISIIDEKDTDCYNLVHMAYGTKYNLQKAVRFQINKIENQQPYFKQQYTQRKLKNNNSSNKDTEQQKQGGRETLNPSFIDFMTKHHDKKRKPIKSLAYNDLQLRKIRALYGRRGTFCCSQNPFDNNPEHVQHQKKQTSFQPEEIIQLIKQSRTDLPENAHFMHRFIINPESKWKSIFDVFILVLVMYSCITNMLFVTFPIKNEIFQTYLFWIVECFFYLDFIFSWFQGFKHPFNQNNIMEFRPIAKNYLKGWFFIDFICIIPVQLISQDYKNRSIKLLRLPRLLRLTKLLNIKTIKRLMKQLEGEIRESRQIVVLYNKLFLYRLTRLLMMMMVLTYFLGCIWFIISNDLQQHQEVTWYTEFVKDKYEKFYDELIVSLYFALTMLSTVGYGDMYPITNLEMILSVIWMFIGVALFSIIMGQFERSKAQNTKELGDPDRKAQLDLWINTLKKYTRGQNTITPSLKRIIYQDFNYFMLNDRNQYFFDKNSPNINLIPKRVQQQLCVEYLFADMLVKFQRFFNATYCGANDTNHDYNLIPLITQGLKPRFFSATDDDDRHIYQENMEVEEMYFIFEGKIGIGFQLPCYDINRVSHQLVKKQKGTQIIGDYYVIHKKRALFMHVVMQDCKSFGLKKRYLHSVVFPKFPDFYQRVSERSYAFYKHWIYKPVSNERKLQYDDLNQARLQTSWFYINDNVSMRIQIPTRFDYVNYLHQKSRESRNKRKIRDKLAKLLSGINVDQINKTKKYELFLDDGEGMNTDKYFDAIQLTAKRSLDVLGNFYGKNLKHFTSLAEKIQEQNIYTSNNRLIGFQPDPKLALSNNLKRRWGSDAYLFRRMSNHPVFSPRESQQDIFERNQSQQSFGPRH